MGVAQPNVAAEELKENRKRRLWSTLERRQIVEETMKPGASVSLVARAHNVNTNQVFKWRKLYSEGRLDIGTACSTPSKLLAVRISDSVPVVASTRVHRQSKTRRGGSIDIDLGHARVRIEGAADPDCIRAALDGLVR